MAQHRFVVGQSVEFLPGTYDGNVPRGMYTIVRLLPIEARNSQYRVKHLADGHERVVTESQLREGPPATPFG